MSWRDPKSPWAIAMRRRRRIASWIAVALPCGVVGAGVAFFKAFRVPIHVTEAPVAVLVAVGLVLASAVVAAWWAIRGARRTFAIARLVPAHDGQVCRDCLRVLEVEQNVGECPSCGAVFKLAEQRAAWERYALEDRDYARPEPGIAGARRDWWRSPWIGLAGVVPMLILFALGSVWVPGPIMVRAAPWWGFAVLTTAGYALKQQSRLRYGDALHCGTCGYQLAPEGNPANCPECGRPWLEPGEIMRGAPGGQPWMRTWGNALIVAAVALFLLACALV